MDELALTAGEDTEPPPFRDLIAIYYGPLTDFTHPNWLGLTTSSTFSAAAPPTWVLQPDFEPELLGAVLQPTEYGMLTGDRALDEVVAAAHRFPLTIPVGEPRWAPGDTHDLPRG